MALVVQKFEGLLDSLPPAAAQNPLMGPLAPKVFLVLAAITEVISAATSFKSLVFTTIWNVLMGFIVFYMTRKYSSKWVWLFVVLTLMAPAWNHIGSSS